MKERLIFHVDVNSAYLSWEAVHQLKNGASTDIRTIPSIIGGDTSLRKGVVLAKSLPAKRFRIHTGEPVTDALTKCPTLQSFQPNFPLYHKYSKAFITILKKYAPVVEQVSIDEAYLDMSGLHYFYSTPLEAAEKIQTDIRETLDFTVNIGISSNKLLAKMASDFTKPDRVHTLYEEEIPEKMWNLPISELFMIGKKTVPKLYNMGIKKIGQLAKTDEKILVKKFGKFGKMMWEYANGIDNSEVNYLPEKPKSIGNSVTLPVDISDIEQLEEVIVALTEQVTYRLRKENLLANVVNVQLRTKDFEDFSHQAKLDCATSSTKEILKKAKELLNEMYRQGIFIRLIGVRVDNLVEKDELQLSLFGNTESHNKQEKLDKILDGLNEKYGYDFVKRAGKMNIDKLIKLKPKLK